MRKKKWVWYVMTDIRVCLLVNYIDFSHSAEEKGTWWSGLPELSSFKR